MADELHAKWRIARASLFGWFVQEWNYENSSWVTISIRFHTQREAIFYLHCNALMECVKDGEDWKLLQ